MKQLIFDYSLIICCCGRCMGKGRAALGPLTRPTSAELSVVADELNHSCSTCGLRSCCLPPEQWYKEAAKIRARELSVPYHGWPARSSWTFDFELQSTGC